MKYILVSLLFVDIEGVVFIMLNGAKFLAHTPSFFFQVQDGSCHVLIYFPRY